MQSNPGSGVPDTGGNDDAVWRDLVARLEEPSDSFLESMGTTADPNERKSVFDFDPLGVWEQATASPEPQSGPSSPGARDYTVEEPDDEFVPEELPSLRSADPAIMLSWIGAAGGPLFLVFSAIFWRQIPMLLVIAVIVAFIAGTGYLLYRLPSTRDHDSGDGAVV